MTTCDEKIKIIKKAIEHNTNGIELFADIGYTLSYIEGVIEGEIDGIAEDGIKTRSVFG